MAVFELDIATAVKLLINITANTHPRSYKPYNTITITSIAMTVEEEYKKSERGISLLESIIE
jgi:hypothetical protein